MLACHAWDPSLRAGDLHPPVPPIRILAVPVMRDLEADFGSLMLKHINAEVLSCHAGARDSQTLPRGVGDADPLVHRSARVSRQVAACDDGALLKPSRRSMTKTPCARANHRNDSMSLISQQIRNFEKRARARDTELADVPTEEEPIRYRSCVGKPAQPIPAQTPYSNHGRYIKTY